MNALNIFVVLGVRVGMYDPEPPVYWEAGEGHFRIMYVSQGGFRQKIWLGAGLRRFFIRKSVRVKRIVGAIL